MKRYILKLAVFGLLIVGFLPLTAQDFDIKVKADTILTPGSKCLIQLSISGGLAPYIYMLYDNEPWEGGKLIEKTSAINDLSHSFTILTPGRYLVGVRDSNDLTKIITIQIKLAGTASIIQISGITAKEYRI